MELTKSQKYSRRCNLEAEIKQTEDFIAAREQDLGYSLEILRTHGPVFGDEWKLNVRNRIDQIKAVIRGEKELLNELVTRLNELGGAIRRRK